MQHTAEDDWCTYSSTASIYLSEETLFFLLTHRGGHVTGHLHVSQHAVLLSVVETSKVRRLALVVCHIFSSLESTVPNNVDQSSSRSIIAVVGSLRLSDFWDVSARRCVVDGFIDGLLIDVQE